MFLHDDVAALLLNVSFMSCNLIPLHGLLGLQSNVTASAVADVVRGNQNRPTADVREVDRSAAREPQALLVLVVVVVVSVVAAAAVEDQTLRVCDHSTEPSSLCHSFA